jgi:hypothetical protein
MFRTRQIAESGERIDSGKFIRSDEAAEDNRCPAGLIASEEGPVVAADRKAPQRPLGTVVGVRQITIGTVPCERGPVFSA